MNGPYHRIENPISQTIADAILQVANGEIWGRAAKIGGLFPCVKAYPNALPDGKRGIDFMTPIAHDRNCSCPHELRWYHPATAGVVLKQKSGIDFACISAVVTNKQP